MARSTQFRQFTVRSVLIATTVLAIGLAVWKSYGVAYATATITLTAATILLVRLSLSCRLSVIFAVLLGSLLWACTRIAFAFFEHWTDEYTSENHAMFCSIGAIVALISSAHFKFKKRSIARTTPFALSKIFAKLTTATTVMLILFGLTFFSLPIVEWSKATNPEANMRTYGSQNGLQVYYYWGRGMDDAMFADYLQDIPRTGKHILIFRYTSISDQSVKRLIQFPNTVALDIRGTRISDAGIQVLRDALPNCKITY